MDFGESPSTANVMTGFRARLSATDILLDFISSIEQTRTGWKSTADAFLDIASLIMSGLAPFLNHLQYGTSRKNFGRFFAKFYPVDTCRFILVSAITENRPSPGGVPQGCLISPSLCGGAGRLLSSLGRVSVELSIYADDIHLGTCRKVSAVPFNQLCLQHPGSFTLEV